MHDAEDRRIRADSQAQREDRRKRESGALAHHPQREPRILAQHRQMLARGRPENPHNRFPPQPQDTWGSVAPPCFLMLFVENGFHFGAEVAPKIEGEEPQKCPINSRRPGISRCHGVLPRRHHSTALRTTPCFCKPLVRRRRFLHAVRVFFSRFLDRAMDRISSILSASAVATCRPCGVNR